MHPEFLRVIEQVQPGLFPDAVVLTSLLSTILPLILLLPQCQSLFCPRVHFLSLHCYIGAHFAIFLKCLLLLIYHFSLLLFLIVMLLQSPPEICVTAHFLDAIDEAVSYQLCCHIAVLIVSGQGVENHYKLFCGLSTLLIPPVKPSLLVDYILSYVEVCVKFRDGAINVTLIFLKSL